MSNISRRKLLGATLASGVTMSISEFAAAAPVSTVNDAGALYYQHVDVFTKQPLSGNGLNVFLNKQRITHDQMLRITQELKQFEAIFLNPTDDPNKFKTRVFTTVEELPFAGHPLLGAAAVLHSNIKEPTHTANWLLELKERTVSLSSTATGQGKYHVTMDQGAPIFGQKLNQVQSLEMLGYLNLTKEDWVQELPLQTVSTGLPHLIVPIKSGLEKAMILHSDFEQALSLYGAKFVYVVDVNKYEARTWENSGTPEDVATASASGPAAAYLVENNINEINEKIVINQGRFVNRPSEMSVVLNVGFDGYPKVEIGADVCLIATGCFESYR